MLASDAIGDVLLVNHGGMCVARSRMYPVFTVYWSIPECKTRVLLYTVTPHICLSARSARRCLECENGNMHLCDCCMQMLGTVGESINPAAWEWYKRAVGGGNVPVVDTYWQTETGGILLCNLPGAWPEKPGAATFPFFGIDLALLDPETGRELDGPATGVLCIKQVRPPLLRH